MIKATYSYIPGFLSWKLSQDVKSRFPQFLQHYPITLLPLQAHDLRFFSISQKGRHSPPIHFPESTHSVSSAALPGAGQSLLLPTMRKVQSGLWDTHHWKETCRIYILIYTLIAPIDEIINWQCVHMWNHRVICRVCTWVMWEIHTEIYEAFLTLGVQFYAGNFDILPPTHLLSFLL